MIEYTHNKKPTVEFIVNRGNFNKIMEVLSFQEENIVNDWKDIAQELKEILLKYSKPEKDEEGEISIINIALYPKEASKLIVLLISAFDNLIAEKDYTEYLKRK